MTSQSLEHKIYNVQTEKDHDAQKIIDAMITFKRASKKQFMKFYDFVYEMPEDIAIQKAEKLYSLTDKGNKFIENILSSGFLDKIDPYDRTNIVRMYAHSLLHASDIKRFLANHYHLDGALDIAEENLNKAIKFNSKLDMNNDKDRGFMALLKEKRAHLYSEKSTIKANRSL